LEVARAWLPDGRRLFQQLSRYDDIVAYIQKRPFYNCGDTLRLILPFLKGVARLTDDALTAWTKKDQRPKWINGAQHAIKHLAGLENVEVFEISASYYPFAALVAEGLGLQQDKVYSTYCSLDRYSMKVTEAKRLAELAREIVLLGDVPEIDLAHPDSSKFTPAQQDVLARLDQIVWGEMAEELPCARKMLLEVRAMGGREKVSAIWDTLERTQRDPKDTIYIGDSITDVEAFRALDEVGGVSVSFNGNKYAIATAKYCSWGDNSLVTALIADVFRTRGLDGLDEFAHAPHLIKDLGKISPVYQHLGTEWGIAKPKKGAANSHIYEQSDKYRKQTRNEAAATTS